MLREASPLKGFTIAATDGSGAAVTDFLFDDESWTLSWVGVETGNGMSGRKVLRPVSVLDRPDASARSFPVRPTRASVKDSPTIDMHGAGGKPKRGRHTPAKSASGPVPIGALEPPWYCGTVIAACLDRRSANPMGTDRKALEKRAGRRFDRAKPSTPSDHE